MDDIFLFWDFLIDLTAFKLNSSFGCLLAGYGSAFLTYFQRWF